MSANIDQSNGRDNIAFLGSRNDIWHRMGNEMKPGMSFDEWVIAAGFNWEAKLVDAYADIGGVHTLVPGRKFNVRSDTDHVLGVMSDQYRNVQPREVLDWFFRYAGVDSRFQMDVAGCLSKGEIVWATAVYNGDMTIAGDKHLARLLMSTTFDASAATKVQCSMTRTVCENTLRVSHSDKRAVISTRHSTTFQPDKVAKELAQLAKRFDQYKVIGDALAMAVMTREQTMDFFKDVLAIDRNANADQISTRKKNQYLALAQDYRTTVSEGAEGGWAALQAVTRYVDHDRSTRNGDGDETESRFVSSQFGSGDALKQKAMGLLMPLIKDRVPVYAA
jgi:phage/plasmid-like protein (TIGR03299 family)